MTAVFLIVLMVLLVAGFFGLLRWRVQRYERGRALALHGATTTVRGEVHAKLISNNVIDAPSTVRGGVTP